MARASVSSTVRAQANWAVPESRARAGAESTDWSLERAMAVAHYIGYETHTSRADQPPSLLRKEQRS
ncbi:MAG: hypothetical protein AMXMBFR34_04880 [Myxococcaceae bacterium]